MGEVMAGATVSECERVDPKPETLIAASDCATGMPTRASLGRRERYASVCLSGIQVRRAETARDMQAIAALRQAGFSRVADGDPEAIEWLDASDRRSGVFSLIASVNGEDLGTLRVQDGRAGLIDLAAMVDFVSLLYPQERPFAQFSRLSMLKTPRRMDAMFGLFKAAWRWCCTERIGGIVIATPPWSKPIYDFLRFRDLGEKCAFRHPFAKNALHNTMALPALDLLQVWTACRHPLIPEFFDAYHPGLELTPCTIKEWTDEPP